MSVIKSRINVISLINFLNHSLYHRCYRVPSYLTLSLGFQSLETLLQELLIIKSL